jgi:hypothetical protein
LAPFSYLKYMSSKSSNNKNLQSAKNSKKDEFYTQLSDIEKELKHYKKYFKDKVVYCNCDDPRVSNFFHFFSYNFERLGLKKLIATCYKSQDIDLFSTNKSEKAIYLEYNGDKNQNNIPDINEIGINYLKGDGDFRSLESIELLKQSDIVVTNPPFSLFREYVSQLIDYDKKFIIIGSQNSISYKEIFNLIKANKLWLGYNSVKRFTMPENQEHNSIVIENGTRYAVFGNICWYTNLDTSKRHEDIVLYKNYTPEEYPFFDNYNAINVEKVKDIPCDYDGLMGVPITFLDKYNPNQFTIVGSDYDVKEGNLPEVVKSGWTGKTDRAYMNGKRMYSRLLIKHKK